MRFIHWLTQQYTVNIITLPRWGWGLIIAAVATAAGLATYAILTTRQHNREADHEMTQAFIREMRIHGEHSEAAPGREANPDDYYSAAPATAGTPAPGPDVPGGREIDPGSALAAAGWEAFPERLGRAEDALIAASDPAAFLAWLEADWADYEADVARTDATLDSGAWAATPWVPQLALAAA